MQQFFLQSMDKFSHAQPILDNYSIVKSRLEQTTPSVER